MKIVKDLLASKKYILLKHIQINDSYLIGIYQGKISEFDILIKFKQKLEDGKWSRLRTPKHIHWTVDLLIKMSHYEDLTKEFLDFLIEIWNKTTPNKNEIERLNSISIETFLIDNEDYINNFNNLNLKGDSFVKNRDNNLIKNSNNMNK